MLYVETLVAPLALLVGVLDPCADLLFASILSRLSVGGGVDVGHPFTPATSVVV
jgi:hypothetical protein